MSLLVTCLLGKAVYVVPLDVLSRLKYVVPLSTSTPDHDGPMEGLQELD